MATSVEDPEIVDTQAGENLGTAATGNEVCVETEESEFEKQEKQRQLRRKNPKKAKRKRVFVVTPQTRTDEKVTTVVNEKGEELLQIARNVDIEKADELFVNEVAAEISDLADDEFQMKPRRYGVNICSYICYWFRNSSFHKKLVNDYNEWYRDWVKYGDMAETIRSVRMREKRLSSELSERRRSHRGEKGTATHSYHEYSSASEEDDKQGGADNDTDDISKVQLHVDDDEK